MHIAMRIFVSFITVMLTALAGHQMGKEKLGFAILDVVLATILLISLTKERVPGEN